MRFWVQTRVLMQQALALLRRHRDAVQFIARAAELRDPFLPLRTELLFEFLAQALRECRAQSTSGNRDLQFAAAHDGREVEIATLRLVHRVAKHSPAAR